MTLTQLEYILAVNKFRHFGKAARSCFVTQPTLSMQLQKLEEELGVMIFDRSKSPILATSEGERIIDQARVIIREQRRLVDLVQQSKDELAGEFRLAVIPTLSSRRTWVKNRAAAQTVSALRRSATTQPVRKPYAIRRSRIACPSESVPGRRRSDRRARKRRQIVAARATMAAIMAAPPAMRCATANPAVKVSTRVTCCPARPSSTNRSPAIRSPAPTNSTPTETAQPSKSRRTSPRRHRRTPRASYLA